MTSAISTTTLLFFGKCVSAGNILSLISSCEINIFVLAYNGKALSAAAIAGDGQTHRTRNWFAPSRHVKGGQ
jgi:hypothetical protein